MILADRMKLLGCAGIPMDVVGDFGMRRGDHGI